MNPQLKNALAKYDEIKNTYLDTLRAKGIVFEKPGESNGRIAKLRNELASNPKVRFTNAGASIITGWQSEACVACTGSCASETFSTTYKCHRDCYFCFNHNQENYDLYFKEGCPWEDGLTSAAEYYDDLACIGLTGGEPLLAFDESLNFLARAHDLFPKAHLRMYTSGDLLTQEKAKRLSEMGLHEIRFSVKDFDPNALQEKVLSNIHMATTYIPDVMVEMPIIPGTDQHMKDLFLAFDKTGIRGINLLEFCFPFHNWDEFSKRGLRVRNPPFEVFYDYLYSGGIPIAGSEELCLELMLYGLDTGVTFGMHYCSLENKHRSEMRQRNEGAAHIHPAFELDKGDFFLKTAKVFGDERERACRALRAAGYKDILIDDEEGSLSFPPRLIKNVRKVKTTPVLSCNVFEKDDDGSYLREVALIYSST